MVSNKVKSKLKDAVNNKDFKKVLDIFDKELGKLEMSNNIDDVITNFNFGLVHNVMEYIDWNWGDHIPSINEMQNKVKKMFKDIEFLKANGEDVDEISTGGFKATIKDSVYKLEFILSDYETFED